MTGPARLFIHGDTAMVGASAVSTALLRAQWQAPLFENARRAELARLRPAWPCRGVPIRVHRNHGFEGVAAAARPYAAWNGLAFEWSIGGYDDSLAFDGAACAEAEILWVDLDRLTGLARDQRAAWLASRVASLRQGTSAPIVVLAWPLDPVERARLTEAGLADVHAPDLDALARDVGAGWLDPRTTSLSGTRLSARALLHVARELACCWLPACLLAPIKAVVVDLDGTLYDGVLAEDGVAGIALTDRHRSLQQTLVGLHERGVLLAVASRNAPADVEALWEQRPDFPLRREHLAAVEVSWVDRGAALARIAESLRIAPDAMVLVDDNPGELASSAAELGVATVHADEGAVTTQAALEHSAGVFRWRVSAEDRYRAADLASSDARAQVARAQLDPDEYLRDLDVRLDYYVGRREHLARVADLVRKTNQFNLSLQRTKEAEIAQRLAQAPENVIAVGLADRLSSSGIVAALVGRQDDGVLHIDEMCVSCRALGRHIEDVMLMRGLLLMTQRGGIDRLRFARSIGRRNQPAREWLTRITGAPDGPDALVVSPAAIRAQVRPAPVVVEVHG